MSDGTPFGAVQVAGDGVPIVLLADRGTAGGYTKIATVIGPDIPHLAQAAPGDTVTFTQVSLDEAYARRAPGGSSGSTRSAPVAPSRTSRA